MIYVVFTKTDFFFKTEILIHYGVHRSSDLMLRNIVFAASWGFGFYKHLSL